MQRSARTVVLAAVLVGCLTGAAMAQVNALEYAIKATYLYKFAPFVTWPETAFASPSAPLFLCVVGDDPFGSTLDRAVAGQMAGDHPIVLRRPDDIGEAGDCHILFVADSPAAEEVLRAVRDEPVLTVTDAALGEASGIVHFVIASNRVRFRIDNQLASAAGLAISSKLLDLALNGEARRR